MAINEGTTSHVTPFSTASKNVGSFSCRDALESFPWIHTSCFPWCSTAIKEDSEYHVRARTAHAQHFDLLNVWLAKGAASRCDETVVPLSCSSSSISIPTASTFDFTKPWSMMSPKGNELPGGSPRPHHDFSDGFQPSWDAAAFVASTLKSAASP